jgi:NAD(P)-dependent dehydrogenase (short-subunit alcohol dehydrogenase family)
MNSLVGLNAKSGFQPDSATKHALKPLADSLRQELNSDGVRILTVSRSYREPDASCLAPDGGPSIPA